MEISDIYNPFSKHCQGNDLLSAASFRNDDICTEHQWEAQMANWSPSLLSIGIHCARRWLMLSVCYKVQQMNPASHRSPNNSGRMTNVFVMSRHCSTRPSFIAVRAEAAAEMKLCHPSSLALLDARLGWSRVHSNAGGREDSLWDKRPHNDQVLRSLLSHGRIKGNVALLAFPLSSWQQHMRCFNSIHSEET